MNYVLLAFGIFTVLAAGMLIFLDKLKGEDIYFNIDVKQQEIKKVIEDADEIISELNYTSEMVVKEIEEKLSIFREELKSISEMAVSTSAAVKKDNPAPLVAPIIKTSRKKKITNDDAEKDKAIDEKLNSKQESVFEYAAQGMSVTEIAKQMNIGQGEVTLILSLKNEVE